MWFGLAESIGENVNTLQELAGSLLLLHAPGLALPPPHAGHTHHLLPHDLLPTHCHQVGLSFTFYLMTSCVLTVTK
jgi:hypothetical protein